jgi:hypothetical protein
MRGVWSTVEFGPRRIWIGYEVGSKPSCLIQREGREAPRTLIAHLRIIVIDALKAQQTRIHI